MNEDQKTLKVQFQGTNKLQNYEILCPLGRGSNSFVYKVKFKPSSKIMAMKVIDYKTNKQQKKAQNEIRINESLNHINIVKFVDKFYDETYCYLIFEYCNQGELYQLSKELQRKKNPQKIYKFFRQLLKGLDYLHQNDIVHGDLKLGNIFMHDDCVKIGDFGLSIKYFSDNIMKKQNLQDEKFLKQSEETQYKFYGTPNYMSPEALTEQKYTKKSDIWSLGCIFYALLFGKTPFQTSNVQSTIQKILSHQKNKFSIQDCVYEDIIKQMLQFDQNQRPSCKDLLQKLKFCNYKENKNLPTKKQNFFTQLLADKQLLKSRRQFHKKFKSIHNIQKVRGNSTKATNNKSHYFPEFILSNSVKNRGKNVENQNRNQKNVMLKITNQKFKQKESLKKNFMSFMEKFQKEKISNQMKEKKQEKNLLYYIEKTQLLLKQITSSKTFSNNLHKLKKNKISTNFGKIVILQNEIIFKTNSLVLRMQQQDFQNEQYSNISKNHQKYYRYVKQVLNVCLQNQFEEIEDNLMGKFKMNLSLTNPILKGRFYKDNVELFLQIKDNIVSIQQGENMIMNKHLYDCHDKNNTYEQMIQYSLKIIINKYKKLSKTFNQIFIILSILKQVKLFNIFVFKRNFYFSLLLLIYSFLFFFLNCLNAFIFTQCLLMFGQTFLLNFLIFVFIIYFFNKIICAKIFQCVKVTFKCRFIYLVSLFFVLTFILFQTLFLVFNFIIHSQVLIFFKL